MGQVISLICRAIRPAQPVRSEAVADLLLALENAPLSDMSAALHRAVGGGFNVIAAVADKAFTLTPDEARLASHALFAEQAFVGATEASFLLMDMADQADARLSAQAARLAAHGAA